MDVLATINISVSTIFLTLFFLLTSYAYVYTSWKNAYWRKRGVPYEKPVPFIGNLQYIMRTSFWDLFYNLAKKYKCDEYFGLYLTTTPVLVVQTPELAKRILVKDSDNFLDRYLYSGYGDPYGNLNIFCAKNPLWGEIRRDLTPMFTSARLRMITDLMNDNAKELVNRIERNHVKKGEAINLKELFSMYASDTVGYTVFGLRVSVLSDKGSPLWYITNHMVKWKFWRGLEFTMIMFAPAVAKLFRCKFFSAPASDFIRRLFWNVANERKKSGTMSNYKDLVEQLLKIQDNTNYHIFSKDIMTRMPDDVMLAQVAVFILGAIETSSTSLSYCMHELAHNLSAQERLYKDIKRVSDEKKKEILDYDDLIEVKYMTSCIQETLRKYPPVAFLERKCLNDYKIDDNLTIEKGNPVYINVLAIHYNEEYYPEPEKWLPERFPGDSDSNHRQYTFLPFGEGPRFCIGKRYGMMQLRAALANILLKYRIVPAASNYKVTVDPYSVFLSPKDGPNVSFMQRN